jgi:CHASE2 domain-containing sensor protein/tRNA A-37 threonylcarbamoyl transferase component Bud32
MKNFKKKIFADWVIGIFLTLLTLGAYLTQWDPLLLLEYKTYDLRSKMVQSEPQSPLVVVAIDDISIDTLGRWPWPRKYVASLVDILSEYGAKVIGVNVFYAEPVMDPGQEEVSSAKFFIETMDKFEENPQLMELYDELQLAEQRLDNDAILASSIESSGKVVLPLFFSLGEKMDNFEVELPEIAIKNSFPKTDDAIGHTGIDVVAPFEDFAIHSLAMGHDNWVVDGDGTVRKTPLVVEFANRYFPSFTMQLVMKFLNYNPSDIKVSPESLSFGKITIPTNMSKEMQIIYRGGERGFEIIPFVDVVSEEIPADEFKDKIVLVGIAATGLGSLHSTPVGPNYTSVEILANIIDNMIGRDFISRPDWAKKVELAVILLFGLYLSFAIGRLKAHISAVVALLLLLIWNGAAIYMFIGMGYWLMMLPPTFLLVVGYMGIMTKRFMATEKSKEKVDSDSIETNKMLGLSFQGQGMLDLALDKFMKCPIEDDDSLKEHLYNLALDFERKRQFNKSVSIYEHIFTDGAYKDVEDKISRLTKVGETMIFGAGLGGGSNAGGVVSDGTDMTPTLGRYEVEKELGRGAMGVVYLGKDPKINRSVAIKTVRFDEIEEDQIQDVKERFFREAEAAGKLSHPNIVNIYDAGEEHDLAYIAMELIDGEDLSDLIPKMKDKCLPPPLALKIVGQVADALAYAQSNGVVHRDIKPANIMFLKDKSVKVTDFGIARVMESSKTQTGVVLGTPSYMSPEQVIGKKVDGRSDLFSLGVMLYELLSGTKPFVGDSMASLMYNIANNPAPNILEVKPGLPKCCGIIVNRFLQKDLEKRYQTGAQALTDIKRCFGVMNKKK